MTHKFDKDKNDPERDQTLNPSQNSFKHGAAAYERDGILPAEWEGYDRKLARELLELVGDDERFAYICTLAARRATLVELAFSWLSREDVHVFWLDEGEDGHNIVRFQPVLTRLFGWMNGLRRDLSELGLTPIQAAKMGLDDESIDAGMVLEAVRDEKS